MRPAFFHGHVQIPRVILRGYDNGILTPLNIADPETVHPSPSGFGSDPVGPERIRDSAYGNRFTIAGMDDDGNLFGSQAKIFHGTLSAVFGRIPYPLLQEIQIENLSSLSEKIKNRHNNINF